MSEIWHKDIKTEAKQEKTTNGFTAETTFLIWSVISWRLWPSLEAHTCALTFAGVLKSLCFTESLTWWQSDYSSVHRRTPGCSAWWWTLTRCCPSTPKRSSRCTRARNGTRCRRTSTPSRTTPTGTWCRVTVCTGNTSITAIRYVVASIWPVL